MLKQLSPCKGCNNRREACHDSCGEYKKWKDFFVEDKQKYCNDKRQRKELQEVAVNGYKNMRTKKASNKF